MQPDVTRRGLSLLLAGLDRCLDCNSPIVVERRGAKATATTKRREATTAAKHLYKEMDHSNVGLNADQLGLAISRAGCRLTDHETRALHRDCDPNPEGVIGLQDFAAAFSLAITREADARKNLKREEKFLKNELPKLKAQREKEERERLEREHKERQREEKERLRREAGGGGGGRGWWGARGARQSKDTVLPERGEWSIAFGLSMNTFVEVWYQPKVKIWMETRKVRSKHAESIRTTSSFLLI